MDARAATIVIGLVVSAGSASALFEITEVDTTIAAYSEFMPISGGDTTKFSTTDFLRFGNGLSTEQALWTYSAGVTFTYDFDGASSATTVSYQGATTTLQDLVYGSQSSTSDFLPLRVVTRNDLTSESTGWTKHPSCATVVYRGDFELGGFTSAGAALSPALVRYYNVCDSGEEIYVGPSKDLSTGGDWAYSSTKATFGTGASEHAVAIDGLEYAFTSAASASTVTLTQAHVVPATAGTTVDTYLLLKFPDGFPAGTFGTTLTATALDITCDVPC